MPQFILKTEGCIATLGETIVMPAHVPYATSTAVKITQWRDLDAFTQGYMQALFFTSGNAPGTLEGPNADANGEGNDIEVGFSDLASATLAAILADCAAFQASEAFRDWIIARDDLGRSDTEAGRDFWFTRNGHGCGFWDGDWSEPHASALDATAKAFRECDAYLGDDGKVHLS